MFVLTEHDATLASYRAGQHETRVGGRRTVERFERGDRRLRYYVAADGRFESSGWRLGFSVMDATTTTTVVLLMVVGGTRGLLDGGQTDHGPFATTNGIVVVVGQRGGRRRILQMFAATVVSGHACYGRIPLGSRSRRTRARFGGVHLVARTVAADGQRLPVVLKLVLVVLVLLMLRSRVAERRAAAVADRGRVRLVVVGCRRWRL